MSDKSGKNEQDKFKLYVEAKKLLGLKSFIITCIKFKEIKKEKDII